MMERKTAMLLRVDIVSDVVCPWCIIGYLQLQKALAQMPGEFELDIHWQPFELNPVMPAAGQDLGEHVAQKYGSTPAQSRGARQRLVDHQQVVVSIPQRYLGREQSIVDKKYTPG